LKTSTSIFIDFTVEVFATIIAALFLSFLKEKNMKSSSRVRKLRTLTSVNIDKVVGSGTFGVVFKAVDRESNRVLALKKIKMEKETQGFPITVRILNLCCTKLELTRLYYLFSHCLFFSSFQSDIIV
jgi:serine/threonine protein kinase